MSNHSIHVQAGRVGSQNRTKKINKMLNLIDEAVAEGRDEERDVVVITSSYLADELNYSRNVINANGFPSFFERYYECTKYWENDGLHIKVEEWTEIRKEEREKLSEMKSGGEE